jgi:hypothetical protein
LFINVLLIGQEQVKKPGVKLLVEQKDVAIVGIQLAEHVEVKQSSLPQKIV